MADPTTTVWALPPPPRYRGDEPCPACHGAKISGERYRLVGDSDRRVLLVDEFCPSCGGCGRARHDACTLADHVDHFANGPLDLDDDDAEWSGAAPTDRPCPSCSGRRYWVAQAYGGETHHLRVPCGCSEGLLVRVLPDGS